MTGNEELAATIAAPDIELSAELRSRLGPFFEYAVSKSVRRLPARPASVACLGPLSSEPWRS